jgi:hypothetical protein
MSRHSPIALLSCLLLTGLAACGGGGGGSDAFQVGTTAEAATGSAPLVVRGRWLVFLASETFTGLGGTDFNSDGDTSDSVAAVVDMDSGAETRLDVATLRAEVLGNEIYLVVDEGEDGTDWSGTNGTADVVLLHWSSASGVLTFVEVLAPTGAQRLVRSSNTLFYRSAATPVGADESTLHALTVAAPTTPLAVQASMGLGQLDPEPLSVDDDLLFLALDENGATDFNSDGDTSDAAVLALLDGTDAMARIVNVALAMADSGEPVAARATAADDWLVAFLVDEASQGGSNLNDQALFDPNPLLPDPCIAVMSDGDAGDRVLHYLQFQAFTLGNPAQNTGLCGQDRVLVLDGVVATIASEADSTCDLNDDGDSTDLVVRWAVVASPYVPERRLSLMHAVDTTIAGGSLGLSSLNERLIVVIPEADDGVNIDGKPEDNSLVTWVQPTLASPVWVFAHQNPTRPSFGTGIFDSMGDSEPFAGTSWMAPEPVGNRLAMTFLESVPGSNPDVGSLNTNLDCSPVAKDIDKVDALPVWCDYETGPTLDFDGLGYAVDTDNAGIVIAAGFVFFRVDEMADNRDYNGDGFADDWVLMRNPLSFCEPTVMGTSSAIAGPVIVTDGDLGAGFLSSEGDEGRDFNGDGDTGDVVVRWFRLR